MLPRTPEQDYAYWVRMVNETHKHGWKHVNGWVFENRGGLQIDLSATSLDAIEGLTFK